MAPVMMLRKVASIVSLSTSLTNKATNTIPTIEATKARTKPITMINAILVSLGCVEFFEMRDIKHLFNFKFAASYLRHELAH